MKKLLFTLMDLFVIKKTNPHNVVYKCTYLSNMQTFAHPKIPYRNNLSLQLNVQDGQKIKKNCWKRYDLSVFSSFMRKKCRTI